MRALLLAIPLLLAASGCCGGYSVVRTTVASGADLPSEGASDTPRGSAAAAFVLHYSRLGEPPNACGSGAQYLERLWVKVPSIAAGQTHTIGAGGVTAVYSREEAGAVSRASSIEGSIRINEVDGAEVSATVSISITLPTGDVVTLDDDY
ncbi:MAG TPA: hypothetical protein VK459_18870, partial [Polyangiaceae bacterium]|nr:hypothetical protein [Polyangiaceae bacterium]